LAYVIYSGIKNFRSTNSGKCSGCCGCSASKGIKVALKQKKSCC
jgi:hypothetical protein